MRREKQNGVKSAHKKIIIINKMRQRDFKEKKNDVP